MCAVQNSVTRALKICQGRGIHSSLGPMHTGEVLQRISVQLHFKNQILTQKSCQYQSKNDFLFIFSDAKIVFMKFIQIHLANFAEFI